MLYHFLLYLSTLYQVPHPLQMLHLEICLQKLAEIKQAGSLFKHLTGQQDMNLRRETLGLVRLKVLIFLETLVEFLKIKWEVF